MSKVANGYEIIQLFESYSPQRFAVEGDKIGLQIGTLNKPIHNVMITLDLLEEVANEAIEKKVDLIIAHHPPIFRPLKNIVTDKPAGKIIEKCLKNDIAVYAAHTNLDVADGGVNDLLAEALGLTDTEVLAPTFTEPLKKLVVFVPKEKENVVREAIGNAGAGHIGNYSHCTFKSNGTGTFLPLEESIPYIGNKGSMEFVEEVRLETIFPAFLQKKIIKAMEKAHPYEEVAYDIYPLDNKGEEKGLGRIGNLPEEMTLQQFAEMIKKSLQVEGVRMVGSPHSIVKKAAVLGGDGNKYIHTAKFKGADVFVTGDLYFHVAHDAMMMGLNVIDPGHHVEKVMMQGVTNVLLSMCNEKEYEVSIFPSEVDTNPFKFI
ncbi:Nif3-like dinuclear metal center hexameric protein [Metabacillus arenae]|uniref:GTP cyclohydrolase 1 type 2 homolog n=1 Tax=Metabacillus arenae TaxID=2771434 RepID=A0A926NK78_9BACI|nr:Nif3-like dinuclear metal center hexameric protein [Metabacillus arenae]MBD1382123.1 Nif3-like dinuclear metal center hexameric protein [Metabacillus arenae]